MAEAVTRGVGGSAAWYGRQSRPVGIRWQSLGTRRDEGSGEWGVGSGESNDQEE
mgnify:CR=1 FL=1